MINVIEIQLNFEFWKLLDLGWNTGTERISGWISSVGSRIGISRNLGRIGISKNLGWMEGWVSSWLDRCCRPLLVFFLRGSIMVESVEPTSQMWDVRPGHVCITIEEWCTWTGKCSAYRMLTFWRSFRCNVNLEVEVSWKVQFVAIRSIRWCRVLLVLVRFLSIRSVRRWISALLKSRVDDSFHDVEIRLRPPGIIAVLRPSVAPP